MTGDGQHSGDTETGDENPFVRFFLADRRVGWLTGSATLAATQVSAGTFVGAVGIHYAVGVSFFLAWVGIWLGWLFSLLCVAPQLRSFGGVTVPEFVGHRFDDDGADGDRIQAVTAVVIACIYLVFTSAQYVAGSVVLESAFGVQPLYGMTALAVLALLYTSVGGMWASVVTDLVLVGVMIVGLVLATIFGLLQIGWVTGLHSAVVAADPALLGLNMEVSDIAGFTLAFGLSLSVAPYEVSRIYAMRDEKTVGRAIGGSIAIQIVIAVCVVVLGLLARVQFPGLSNPDAAVVTLVTSYFGPIVSSVLLLAVLAAVLSTVDSILLVSSSAIAYDLYDSVLSDDDSGPPDQSSSSHSWPVLNRFDVQDTDSRTLRVAQGATVAAGLLPLFLAVNSDLLGGLVEVIVALYAALVAGALFAPVVLGIHWESATGPGAVTGMITGTVGVVVWHFFGTASGPVPTILAALPPVVVGVGTSFLGMVVVSVGR